MKRYLLAGICAAITATANAGNLYKCQGPGKAPVYSSEPCEKNGQAEEKRFSAVEEPKKKADHEKFVAPVREALSAKGFARAIKGMAEAAKE